MATGMFICAWAILWLAPETGMGRFLRRWILRRPAARTRPVTGGQVLLAMSLLAVAIFLVWLLRADGARLLAASLPELGIWITSFEVTTWLDAIAGVALMSAATSLPAMLPTLRRAGHRLRPRSRDARVHQRVPANDDERLSRPRWAA